jgi:hypothetical protein
VASAHADSCDRYARCADKQVLPPLWITDHGHDRRQICGLASQVSKPGFSGALKGDRVERLCHVVERRMRKSLRLAYFQATVAAARHEFIAETRKARYVDAEVRWRWTLKML